MILETPVAMMATAIVLTLVTIVAQAVRIVMTTVHLVMPIAMVRMWLMTMVVGDDDDDRTRLLGLCICTPECCRLGTTMLRMEATNSAWFAQSEDTWPT